MDNFLGRCCLCERSGWTREPRAHWRANRASATKTELQEVTRNRLTDRTRHGLLTPCSRGPSSFVQLLAREQRTETRQWRAMLVCQWHVFVWQSVSRAACRACRYACVPRRSHAAPSDWPLIDRVLHVVWVTCAAPVRFTRVGGEEWG